jgi:hypothetical protein
MKEKLILTSASMVYKETRKGTLWFLVKTKDSDWEIPKTNARRGESSVRAGIRMMLDQAELKARVLEEVGRFSGAIKVGDNPVSQKTLYYLMVFETGGEVIGFEEYDWFDYKKALRTLKSKREIQMLKKAKVLKKELDKETERKRKP